MANPAYIGGDPKTVGQINKMCHGTARVSGKRCGSWAIKGTRYCPAHTNTSDKFKYARSKILNWGRRQEVKTFYSQALGPKLSEFLSSTMPATAKEMFDVKQELAIARASSLNAVQMFSQVNARLESGVNEKTNLPLTQDERTGLLATGMVIGSQLMQSMKNVAEIAEKAQKIHEATVATVTVEDVGILVQQITRILYDICGTHYHDIAVEFEQKLSASVKIPTSVAQAQGTMLSPDAAMEMMASTLIVSDVPKITAQ